MLNSFSNKAILAKARAMYGNRLTEDDYNEMLRKRSVSEVAAYLKGTKNYADALSNINEATIHRGQLEAMLRRDLFNRYVKLCKYENAKGREDFYYYIVRESEIDQILRCIMLLNAGEPEKLIIDLPGFLISHASFSLLELAKVRSYEELLEALHTTPYYEVLKKFPPDEKGQIDYTRCEVALKTLSYSHLIELARRSFVGKTEDEILEIIKIDIELTNLNIIFRLKTYFHKTPEEIREYLYPFSCKISPSKLNQLVEAEGKDDFLKAFYETRYGARVKDRDYLFIEDYTKRVNYLYNRHLLRFSIQAPSVLYTYVILSKVEISNIISVIEGIRYDVPTAEIQKLLIL